MEKEPKNRLPKSARYPLFLVGLVILIFGGLVGMQMSAPAPEEAGIAIIGFAFVVLSVLLR